jgi:hypothetical protein
VVRKYASLLLLLCLLVAPLAAFGADWTQPTPQELKMTSDPAAPDAAAVYLFREEKVDEAQHTHAMYARIKILTEKGKETFSDVGIPFESKNFKITDIAGRTIHSDGTVIPLTAKPLDKLLVRTGKYKVMEKVFTLPDVQIGSILEYRWILRYDMEYVFPPKWYIAQPVFVHKAHYHFASPQETAISHAEKGESGVNVLTYFGYLPAGVNVAVATEGYDLVVENIPALPDEDYMPPFKSLSYRVIFHYSPRGNADEYWESEGKHWSKNVNHFANPSGKIRGALEQIVVPGDSDEKKVEKIYDEVMKIENTSFTRVHSAAEDKAEHLKVNTVEDVWQQKRGNSDEITRLFIAMVRAAGLKAYAMIVVDRDQNIFQTQYLDWDQLDDELAIVAIGGKEVYFDPGQRYCEFGKLHWKHTWAQGVRQTDSGTQIATTPGPTYQDTEVDRFAELSLDQDGKVHGVLRINMTGAMALGWRQAVLSSDQDDVRNQFDRPGHFNWQARFFACSVLRRWRQTDLRPGKARERGGSPLSVYGARSVYFDSASKSGGGKCAQRIQCVLVYAKCGLHREVRGQGQYVCVRSSDATGQCVLYG